MAGAAPLEAGGAKEAVEEKKKKEKKRGRSSDSRHVILPLIFDQGLGSLFLLQAVILIRIRLSLRIWIRLSLRICIRNWVSDPYSQNPDIRILLNPDPACCWIRYGTDPMRIRIQTKIYYDKYCKKFNLGIWSKTVKNFFSNFLERTFRHEFLFFLFLWAKFRLPGSGPWFWYHINSSKLIILKICQSRRNLETFMNMDKKHWPRISSDAAVAAAAAVARTRRGRGAPPPRTRRLPRRSGSRAAPPAAAPAPAAARAALTAQTAAAPAPETVCWASPLYQCCGSGIRCLFDPWIRDLGWVKNQDPGWTTRIIFPRA